jgi:hypothetical protein
MKTARPDRVSVTRRVAASPRAVWLIVCDPARHVDIDSSGMLQVAPDVRPLTRPARPSTWTWTAVPLGDIPTMAEDRKFGPASGASSPGQKRAGVFRKLVTRVWA